MSHVTHMNESCHTYERVMSHIWTSHVTHMNESRHTNVWAMPHIWTSHVSHINESCHTCQSCHTYEYVMLQEQGDLTAAISTLTRALRLLHLPTSLSPSPLTSSPLAHAHPLSLPLASALAQVQIRKSQALSIWNCTKLFEYIMFECALVDSFRLVCRHLVYAYGYKASWYSQKSSSLDLDLYKTVWVCFSRFD